MLVLGIDPGTRHLGWGVVRGEGNRVQHIAHGVIHASDKWSLAERLLAMETELSRVIREHRPHVGSVESLFFHRDPQAASKLGHARGVVLLNLQREQVAVAEYSPARVKLTLTGSGRAEKLQVARMVQTLLGLSVTPQADAADALALALTHLRRSPVAERLASLRAANPELHRLLAKPRRRRAASR